VLSQHTFDFDLVLMVGVLRQFAKQTSKLSSFSAPRKAAISIGDTIPPATFSYVPYSPELEDGVFILRSRP
jgi:hypothetical protein